MRPVNSCGSWAAPCGWTCILRGDHPVRPFPFGFVTAEFSPDGARLLTGGLLCDGMSGSLVAQLDVDLGTYLEGGPPEHGRRLTNRFFIEAAPLRGFCVWDAVTGELLVRDQARRYGAMDRLAISPDGDRYAVLRHGRSMLEIRDVGEGRELSKIDVPATGEMVFSADGSRLAFHTDAGDVWIVDRGGILTHVGTHPCQVRELAFSCDGHLLASSDQEKRVRVWDPRRGLLAERQVVGPGPLSESIHGWSEFRAHAHPFRTRNAAGLAEIVDERSGDVIARIPADEPLISDAQGRRWASRCAHYALEAVGSE